MVDRQSPTPGSCSSMQEQSLVEEKLHTLLESPTNEDNPAEMPSTGFQSSTQEPHLEEESPINEETPAETPSAIDTQDEPQQTVETVQDKDAGTSDNALETEEQQTASRAPGTNGRRALRRVRRSRAAKLRSPTFLDQIIGLDERHISLTRDDSIMVLNHASISFETLATFITACKRRRRIPGPLN